jgi:heme/copper-type cytochrome/quinol oxidase subunit 3
MSKKVSAAVVPLRPRAQEEFSKYLGMVLMLGSWSILFGGLFFAYAGVRMGAPVWPPPGVPKLPVLLPAVNTMILAVSSFTAQRGLAEIRKDHRDTMRLLVALTVFLGALFLGLQYVVWSNVRASGMSIDSGGAYGSVFYTLTIVHAAHVVAGLGGLVYLLVMTGLGRWNAAAHSPVRMWTMFWHFLDAVWVVTFFTVFVL